jgi:ribosomal protein S18 acetylase RimI-like enzyme
VLEPPLAPADARLVRFAWPDVRQMVVEGRAAVSSLDRFFVGLRAGAPAGSLMYATPRDTRDVAVLEFVWTEPAYRRQGVATALLGAALADFRAGGGAAMYLCTTNPHAYALYDRAGFRPLLGDRMRYLAPGHEDFDRTYFAYAGPASVRPAEWGDLARAAALYNRDEPDWLIKDYHLPRRVFRDTRYESHFIQVWRPAAEGRGTLTVLANPRRRVVGMAGTVATPSYYEQHVHLLDFWCCAAYLDEALSLIAAAVERAGAAGAEVVQACLAAADVGKQRLLGRAGFAEEARLRRRLLAGAARDDLLVFSRFLPERDEPGHPREAYYGHRHPFHRAAPARRASRPHPSRRRRAGRPGSPAAEAACTTRRGWPFRR